MSLVAAPLANIQWLVIFTLFILTILSLNLDDTFIGCIITKIHKVNGNEVEIRSGEGQNRFYALPDYITPRRSAMDGRRSGNANIKDGSKLDSIVDPEMMDNAKYLWAEGWQPVPTAVTNYADGSSSEFSFDTINKKNISFPLPRKHKIFSLIQPGLNPNKAEDDNRNNIPNGGRVPNSNLNQDENNRLFSCEGIPKNTSRGFSNTIKGNMGTVADMLSSWCFTSFGCWGGGNLKMQRNTGKWLSRTVAGNNLGLGSTRQTPGSSSIWSDAVMAMESSKGADMNEIVSSIQKKLCQNHLPVLFHIAAGDNFYPKGLLNKEDIRYVRTFELSYPQRPLVEIPWLLAHGNHDYRLNFFAQIAISQRRNVYEFPSLPKTSHITADDTNPPSSSSVPSDPTPMGRADIDLFTTGRWYFPYPYYSARVSKHVLIVTLDCPLMERCHHHGEDNFRCWDNGAQKRWLERLLLGKLFTNADSDDSILFRIMVCHYPMYANGPHVNHKWLVNWLEPLMVKHCFQLYINADNHYIQVSKKEYPSSSANSPPNTVYYVNSGGGGGIELHRKKAKGYRRNPYSVFEQISNGFFSHCLIFEEGVGQKEDARERRPTKMVNTATDDSGNVVFTFETPSISKAQCIASHRKQGNDPGGEVVSTAIESQVNESYTLSSTQIVPHISYITLYICILVITLSLVLFVLRVCKRGNDGSGYRNGNDTKRGNASYATVISSEQKQVRIPKQVGISVPIARHTSQRE